MARTETVRLNIDGKGSSTTLKELQRDASRLRNILANLDPNSEKAEEYKRKFDQVNGAINDVKGNLGLVKKKTEEAAQAGSKMGRAFSKAGEIMKGALAATGILALIDNVLSLIQGFGNLAAQSIEVRSQLARLTGETGEGLDQLTAKVQAFAARTGKEPVEVIRALNVSMNAFGTSAEETFTNLNNLTTLAVDAQGDLLDVVAEYAPQLAEAGVSQEAFFATLINAERSGAFSLDKVGDFYKEFGLRIREQTTATSDALAALGTGFRDQLFAELNAGTLSVDDALIRIVDRIEETGVKGSELQTIIADTFGGPGEDLGKEFLLTLNDTSASFDELVNGADAYTKAQFRIQEAQEKFFLIIGNIVQAIQSFGAELIARADPLIQIFVSLGQETAKLFGQLRNIAVQLGLVSSEGSAAQFVIDALTAVFTVLAIPIRTTIALVQGIINGFVALYNSSETLRGILGGLGAAVVSIFTNMRDAALSILGGVGDILAGIFTLDLARIQKGFASAASGLKGQYLDLGANAAKAFAEGYEQNKGNVLDPFAIDVPVVGSSSENPMAPTDSTAPTAPTDPTATPLGISEEEKEAALESINDFYIQKKDAELLQIEGLELSKEEMLQRFRDQSLQADKDINQAKLEEQRKFEEARIQVQQEALAATSDLIATGIELLGEEQAARSGFGEALKALKIAEIGISSASEIQKIWEYANSNPANALFPGAANVIAGVKTAAAVGRAAIAAKNIVKQKFADGGRITGPSHAAGGVPFTVNGQQGFEAEGNEYIVNKAATSNNLAALDTINRLGDRMAFKLVPAIRFATGGLTPSIPNVTGGQAEQESSIMSMEMFEVMIGKLDEIGQKLDSYEREKQIFLPFTDIEDTAAKVAEIRAQ